MLSAGVEYDNLVNSSSSPAPPPVPKEKEVGRREISPGTFCLDKDLMFRYNEYYNQGVYNAILNNFILPAISKMWSAINY